MRSSSGRIVATIAAALLVGGLLAPPAGATALRWTRELGRQLDAVAVDAQGNSYLAGMTEVGDRGAAFLVKMSPDGRKIWSRSWRPPGADVTFGTAVAIAPDGSIVWGGKVYVGCEGGGWFLQRITANGRVLWTRAQDGWRECAVATHLTDLVVGRRTIFMSMYDHGCCGDTYADAFVQAFTLGGAPSWRHDVEPPGVWRGFHETATSLAIGGLDNVYLVGWAATKRRPGDYQVPGFVFIEKLSPGGGTLWQRRVEPSWWRITDAAIAVRDDAVLVASKRGPKGDAYLTGFSVGGDRSWTTTWGAGTEFGSTPHGVSIDAAGTIWVAGERSDPADDHINLFVKAFSRGGGPTWSLVIDGRGHVLANGIDAWGDGSAVMAGENRRLDRDRGRVWAVGPA